MATDCTLTIIGNLTRDPEMRYTPAGAANATFGVAVNKRWLNKQTNEWDEQVSFFNVIAWRDLAENIAATLSKGMRVVVHGSLEQRTWDDKDTGDKRSAVEVVADEVAPSLRWATAVITKTPPRGEGGQQQSRPVPSDDPSHAPF